MIYDWYKIFNKVEFEALDLVSKEYILNLEGKGQKSIFAFKAGSNISIQYEGVFLTVNLHDKNPFDFDSHAVYIDALDDVYLGVAVA